MLSGYLAALFSALMWGSNNVPVKKSTGYDSYYFGFLMSLGIFLVGLIISIVNQSFVFTWWGIFTGFIWSIGNILTIYAIRYIGLARSMPVLQGVIIPVSFFSGLVFFSERVNNFWLAIISLILFAAGGYFLTAGEADEKPVKIKLGLFLSIVAGLIFGLYGVPFGLSGVAARDFIFSVSLGILLTSTSIYLVKFTKPKREYVLPAMTAGGMWNLGNFSSFFAISSLGLTLGYPLTQLAMFVNILWGVVYFKEIKSRKAITKIVLGSVLLFAGAILLSLSK
jgi:glucose uptake protein